MKTKEMVEYCLKAYPETANSDVQLTFRIIHLFYNQHIRIIDGKWWVSCEIQKIIREDHVKRIRAKFNEEGKYLPTDPEVIKQRRLNEQVWHEEYSPSNPARG